MTDITVTIDNEYHDQIVLPILYQHLQWTRSSRKNAVHKDDKKMYKKDIKALEQVIDYFGGICD